jgi:hypothetical protein
MGGMPKYSLRELLYWQTVWIGVLLLIAKFGVPSPIALFAATVWFIGTVVAYKAYGSNLSFAFSFAAAFAICLVGTVTASIKLALTEVLFAWMFSSAVGGSLMWGLVAAADGVFKQFSRSISGDSH